MTTNTKTYGNLLSGEYWELYRVHDYGTDDVSREPIGYMRAGVEFTDDIGDKEANPSDSGVIQQGHGKSMPGVEFEGMTAYYDEDNGESPLIKMAIMTEDGMMTGNAEWEAAEIWIYNDDPSLDNLDLEPKEIAECPAFGIKTESMEYDEDDFGSIDFEAYMNAYPYFPLQAGEDVPDLDDSDGGD